MTEESWSDERLTEAYRAVVNAPAPGLRDAVIAAVREEADRNAVRRTYRVIRRWTLGMAAAVALIAILAIAPVLMPGIRRLGGPATPGLSGAPTPGTTRTPSAVATRKPTETPVAAAASASRVVTLTTANGRQIRFEIVDPAHLVLDAREATNAEVDAAGAVMTAGAAAVRLPNSASFVIAWTGSGCDSTARLTVDVPPSSWRLRIGGRMGCDANAEGHGVVVTTRDGTQPTLAFTDAPLVPQRVAGLEVITVANAVAQRDAKLDDTELAVFGYRNDLGRIGCPFQLGLVSPVQPRCPDQFEWLMQNPEGGTTTSPPIGPAINPLVRIGIPTAIAAGVGIAPDRPHPVAVVLVGHFDDYRSALCPKGQVNDCRKQFVVDAEAWVDGVTVPDAVAPELQPLHPIFTSETAPTVLQRANHHPITRWVVAVNGADVETIDPRAKGSALATAAIVWVIREAVDVAGRPVVVTYFVVDGSETSYFKSNASGISGYGVIVGTPPD